jgi:GDPmannose 4,6-dehydratase
MWWATGECHSVREFAELAFSQAGLDYRQYIKTDPEFYRPGRNQPAERGRR